MPIWEHPILLNDGHRLACLSTPPTLPHVGSLLIVWKSLSPTSVPQVSEASPIAGTLCGLIGQGITNGMIMARNAILGRNTHGENKEVPNIWKTSLVWGLFMGMSSNYRCVTRPSSGASSWAQPQPHPAPVSLAQPQLGSRFVRDRF